jgi:hypothetical protein
MYHKFPLRGFLKYLKIEIFGMKIYHHLATLVYVETCDLNGRYGHADVFGIAQVHLPQLLVVGHVPDL